MDWWIKSFAMYWIAMLIICFRPRFVETGSFSIGHIEGVGPGIESDPDRPSGTDIITIPKGYFVMRSRDEMLGELLVSFVILLVFTLLYALFLGEIKWLVKEHFIAYFAREKRIDLWGLITIVMIPWTLLMLFMAHLALVTTGLGPVAINLVKRKWGSQKI